MWEKIKNSKFGRKIKELSGNKAAVVTCICLLMALTVIVSVSIANNRAKQKYLGEGKETQESGEVTEAGTVSQNNENPVYNESKPSSDVNAQPSEFSLALPVTSGSVAKGHDATLQVWSSTMGDYRVHLGIDIATEADAPVFAAADGVIAKVWDDALMGRCIAIEHKDNMFTIYKNLSDNLSTGIKEGAEIKCGQKLGTVGDSAIAELADEPHLHLEMTVNGLSVDPLEYFNEATKKMLSVDTSYEPSASAK